jgi:hypothetical protein
VAWLATLCIHRFFAVPAVVRPLVTLAGLSVPLAMVAARRAYSVEALAAGWLTQGACALIDGRWHRASP